MNLPVSYQKSVDGRRRYASVNTSIINKLFVPFCDHTI